MFRQKRSMCITCENSKSNKCYLLDFSKKNKNTNKK